MNLARLRHKRVRNLHDLINRTPRSIFEAEAHRKREKGGDRDIKVVT